MRSLCTASREEPSLIATRESLCIAMNTQYNQNIFTYFLFIFLIGSQLFYNSVVVFAMRWHESAMVVHVFPVLNALPPPSPSHPSGSSQCTSPEHPVSCIEPGLAIYFTYVNIHVSMLFFQIIPPSPSPIESKNLFFTSMSLLLSHI